MENMTDWEGLMNRFEEILTSDQPEAPYNDPDYLEYTKLNKSRLNRWIKTGKINDELSAILKGINQKQTWYLILEPWCGDAAHNSPFIHFMSQLNDKITLKIVYRDTPPLMIEDYLTNGGKSIPKLVVRDENEKDLFVWGPRPANCQNMFLELKEKGIGMEEIKLEIQNWYNKDKGNSIQEEFIELLR